MSRAPVTQTTITRAVKAVQAAGVVVGRVEVQPDGKVVVYTAAEDAPKSDDDVLNDWVSRHGQRKA